MKHYLLILLASLLSLAASADESRVIYSINFSQSQTGWNCYQYSGKPWAFQRDAYYDSGSYYSSVTMARNYSGKSLARYASPAITLETGTYAVRTLALKEGGNPVVRLYYIDQSNTMTLVKVLTLGTKYDESYTETNLITVGGGTYNFVFEGETQDPNISFQTPHLFRFEVATPGSTGGSEGGGEGGGGEEGGEEVETGVTVFTSDFASQSWTAIDANSDGHTWAATGNRWAYNGMTATTGADDYIVSPAISVESGTNYEVQVKLKQSSAFDPDQVELFYGNSASLSALKSSLGLKKMYGTNGAGLGVGTFRLCADKTGDIRIAVRVKGAAANGLLALRSLTVTTTSKAKPEPVTGMTAVSDPDNQTVKLTWKNPTKDVKGLSIVQPLSVRIYENGKLVKTLTDREKGKSDTYTHTPTKWGGEATYRVAAVIGTTESDYAEQKINLDDNKGELELVKSFATFSKNEFNANWYIENIVGTEAWKWGYANTAMFDYPMSKNQDDWLITPNVPLESGKRYLVQYRMQTGESYYATMYVTIGNAQRPAAQTTTIQEHVRLYQNGMKQFTSRQFTVPTSGDYYIGFHVTEAEVAVHLQTIEVYEVKSTGSSGEGNGGDEGDDIVEDEYFDVDTDADSDDEGPTFSTFDPQSPVILGTEGVDMMGAINYAMLDVNTQTVITSGYYAMEQENGYLPNPAKTLRGAYAAGGACYHDGLIYSNEFNDEAHIDKEEPMWRVYDARTFELVSEHKLPDYCRATTNVLTYDVTEDAIYGFNYTYTETYLVRINPQTGEMTRIGDFFDRNLKFLSIASRKDGMLYCIFMDKTTTTHYLARLRKSDATLAAIGPLVCGGFMSDDPFVNGGYQQCAWFCNANDKLYWLHYSSSNHVAGEDYTPIMEVDIDHCCASLAAYLPKHYITGGTFFVEPRFTAPAAVKSFAYCPTNADHTEGYLEVTAPTTDYIGRPLQGNVIVYVMDVTDPDDISEMMAVEAMPGEVVRGEDLELNEGTIRVEVFAVNSADEEGVRLRRKFYAGYDQLKAPSNIVLTADGLTTTLTWDAPTESVHGEVADFSHITYNVLRYPGEILVAKGISERTFTETHPEDMTRYVYKVSSVDNAGVEGPGAFSNNLIVGAPLTVPYGDAFTSAADLFNYYTILDNNGDSHTWTYDTNTNQAIYLYNETQSADDWLISPPIIFERGKHYKLFFTAYSSMKDYPEAFEVCFGDGRTPEQMPYIMHSVDAVPTTATDYSIILPDVEETGVHYFAIHCISPIFHEYLYVNNIHVEETDEQGTPHPSRSEIAGDYVLLNYMTYDEGTDLYLKEMRNFTIAEGEGKDDVVLDNFYVTQAGPFTATYTYFTGNLTIAPGTPIFEFNDGTGSVHGLYAWDEYSSNPTNSNIVYREDAKGWTCNTPLVTMVGVPGEEQSPYYFAQRSVIRRANATTSNNSYIYGWSSFTGQLEIETAYDETRPSYIERDGHAIRIYNLHTIDSYGYGCCLELAYNEATGDVAAYPFICGEMKSSMEYPYKAMAGTEFDYKTNKPVGAYKAGTSQEGWITGKLDAKAGTITLNPVSIYPVSYNVETGEVAIEYRSVYETIKQFVITFDPEILNSDITLGDVNGDGLVNDYDVAALVAHIVGVKNASFIVEAADINGDGTINVLDVTALISLIKNK